jgi:hypothetical protein
VLAIWAVAWIPSDFGADTNEGFLVHGKLTHEQLGHLPIKREYSFTARSDGANWSISCLLDAKSDSRECLAVGNEQGVFILEDVSKGVEKMKAKGELVGPNDHIAEITPYGPPNSASWPQLGPIWITYLSAAYLRQADPLKMPPPVSLNVAGGSSIWSFQKPYYEKSRWLANDLSGLPNEFVAMDEEEYLKGIRNDQLVRIKAYPRPFEKGFTNIVFKVLAYQEVFGKQLPKISQLDVFWIAFPAIKYEKIHHFTIEASDFSRPPLARIPEPIISGVAAVADMRKTTNGVPIVVNYLASNSFPAADELPRFAGFADGVKKSLALELPKFARRVSPLYFWFTVFVISVIFGALYFRNQKISHNDS